uniref:Secreted protein n=1 Tax=Piliocolobus tephrosceles TaxID=591936 RepID=A0A8C9IVJ3_9PRIM
MKIRNILITLKSSLLFYICVNFSNWRQADDFRDMNMGYRTPVITTSMKLGFRKEVNHIRNPVTSMSSCQTTQDTRVNRAQGAMGSW